MKRYIDRTNVKETLLILVLYVRFDMYFPVKVIWIFHIHAWHEILFPITVLRYWLLDFYLYTTFLFFATIVCIITGRFSCSCFLTAKEQNMTKIRFIGWYRRLLSSTEDLSHKLVFFCMENTVCCSVPYQYQNIKYIIREVIAFSKSPVIFIQCPWCSHKMLIYQL